MKPKTIWVCGACGKQGATRMSVGDESCYLNSVEVLADSLKFDNSGRVIAATAYIEFTMPKLPTTIQGTIGYK